MRHSRRMSFGHTGNIPNNSKHSSLSAKYQNEASVRTKCDILVFFLQLQRLRACLRLCMQYMVRFSPPMGNTGTSTLHLWEFFFLHSSCVYRWLLWTPTVLRKHWRQFSVKCCTLPSVYGLVKAPRIWVSIMPQGASHPVGEVLKSWNFPIFLNDQLTPTSPCILWKKMDVSLCIAISLAKLMQTNAVLQ